MEQAKDKYDAMALISGPIAGLKSEQLPGLAHIYRQIARDEREACAKIADRFDHSYDGVHGMIADAIRARTDAE